jgi:hypothetical protein
MVFEINSSNFSLLRIKIIVFEIMTQIATL